MHPDLVLLLMYVQQVALNQQAQWVKLVLIAGVAAVVIYVVYRLYRSKILDFFKRNKPISALKSAEKIVFVAAGALASGVDLWKPSTWEAGGLRALFYLIITLFILWLGTVIVAATEAATESSKAAVTEANTKLAETKGELQKLQRVVVLIRRMVDRKVEQLKEVLAAFNGAAVGNPLGWNPGLQAKAILYGVHELVKHELDTESPGHKLRLGIYTRNGDVMDLLYGWDGAREDCYKRRSEFMKVGDPEGAVSLVVQTYNDQELKVHIVPDTEVAKDFDYFDPKQKNHLRSILTYKRMVRRDGKPSALVVEMDTDRPGFFCEQRRSGIKLLLDEMLSRLEYEMLTLEFQRKKEQNTAAHG